MADNTVASTDLSISDAASAISALMERPREETPETETQDSPQAAPMQAEPGNTEADPVEPGASETTVTEETPVVPAAPQSSTIPPDVENLRQEASKSKTEANAARDQFINALNTLVPQMQSAIRGEFADIKNIDDLENVARTDPERYNRFVFAQARLQQATTAQQQANEVANKEKNEAARQAWSSEQARLYKLMPELTDPVKGSAIAKNLQDYALKIGIKPERLTGYTADEFVALNKSMQFDNLEAAKAAANKKAASAPPVQKPGVTRSGSTKDEKLKTDYERLQKSGRVDDAAAVFRNLFN